MLKKNHILSTSLYCLMLWGSVTAQADDVKYELDITSAKVVDALMQLAVQTGQPLLLDFDALKTLEAPEVKGSYSLQDALDLILQDSDFTGSLVNEEVISVSRIEPKPQPIDSKKTTTNNQGDDSLSEAPQVLAPRPKSLKETEDAFVETNVIDEIAILNNDTPADELPTPSVEVKNAEIHDVTDDGKTQVKEVFDTTTKPCGTDDNRPYHSGETHSEIQELMDDAPVMRLYGWRILKRNEELKGELNIRLDNQDFKFWSCITRADNNGTLKNPKGAYNDYLNIYSKKRSGRKSDGRFVDLAQKRFDQLDE